MAKETIGNGLWSAIKTSLNNMFTELYNSLFNISTQIPVSIIPIAVGREFNIYRNVLSTHIYGDSTKYILFNSLKGRNMNHGYRFTPVNDDIGVTDLVVYCYNYNWVLTSSKTISLKIIAKNGGAGSKNILCVGDSLTQAGVTVGEVADLIVADGGMQAVFIGTQGSTGKKHEGYSGWSWATHLGNTSPFYSSTLGRIDFADYMSKNGFIGNIDYCFVQLGINDVSQAQSYSDYTNTQIVANAVSFITQLLSNYPSCKIVLELEPIGSDDDGSNYAVNSAFYSAEFTKQKMLSLFSAYVAEFSKSTYTNKVYISPAYMVIDRLYGYARVDSNRNARDTTQISYITDGIHPTISGYKQLADLRYSWFRYLNTL